MHIYYITCIAIGLGALFMLERQIRKDNRPVQRADLEFKFRTCQITAEEWNELVKLRAAK